MEKGIKTARKALGILKPDVYDEYYVHLRNGIDALVIKSKGVVLIKGDSMCYVDGVKVEDGKLMRK